MVRMLGDETLCRHDHRSQGTFHIRSAASEKHAVADGWLKRRVDPAVCVACGNYVGMSGKRQRLPLTAPCPEVLRIAKIHVLDGKTDGTQALNH